MPDVNDDMDELFKKAGENYPLNTGSSDWNEVYKNLQPLHTPQVISKAPRKNKYRRLLWLLLLIPFSIAVSIYISDLGNQHKSGESASKKYDTKIAKQKINKENAPEKQTEHAVINTPDSISILKNNINKEKIKTPYPTLKSDDNLIEEFSRIKEYSIRNPSAKKAKDVEINLLNNDKELKENSSTNKGQNIHPSLKDIKEQKTENEPIKETVINSENNSQVNTTENNQENTIENKNIISPGDTSKSINNDLKKTSKKKSSKQQHFYAGILAGPDLSTIKFQKIHGGFNAGIIAGYKVGKKLSIESGLFIDKKNYYSEGKYFSTKRVNISSYTKIDDLDGYCYILEVPVNLKYDFNSNKKAQWFAIAGLSSYFMKKEKYAYRYKHYGQPMEDELSYRNSTNNLAAVINVGIGYSRNIGKTSMLRIEPYIKIPFKGIGIGSLPITSSGVYLGFTKNLF